MEIQLKRTQESNNGKACGKTIGNMTILLISCINVRRFTVAPHRSTHI